MQVDNRKPVYKRESDDMALSGDTTLAVLKQCAMDEFEGF